MNVYDDWPEPPNGTDDSMSYLTSDTDIDSVTQDGYIVTEQSKKSNLHCGTYIIRRGNKKDRIQLIDTKIATESRSQKSPSYCNGETDLKR